VILKELTAFVPQVKQAIAAAPAKRDPLLKLVAKIQADAQGGRVPTATAGLKMLKTAVAGTAPAGGAAPPAAAGASPAAILDELKGLLPQVKQAIAAAPEKREVYLKLVDKIKTDAQGGRAPVAVASLNALKGVLSPRVASGKPAPAASAGAGSAPAANLAEYRTRWRTAREAVGTGLTKLQSVLKGKEEPAFHRVAEFGLNGITGRLQVGLEVALLECESSGGRDPKAKAKAAKVAADFRKFLQTDAMVRLVDENPFGVAIDLRGQLLPVLTDLEAALQA
jgi:hypothetical protein